MIIGQYFVIKKENKNSFRLCSMFFALFGKAFEFIYNIYIQLYVEFILEIRMASR